MAFDMAQYPLSGSWKEKKITAAMSPSDVAYQMLLKEALIQKKNKTRILDLKNKPLPPRPKGISEEGILHDVFPNMVWQRRSIPRDSDQILDAPWLVDNYYLNLLDWGSSNLLSIALWNTLYLWGASTTKLMSVGYQSHDVEDPIACVSWAPDGRRIAIGLYSSEIQLWDVDYKRLVRTLSGVHPSTIGSMDWKNNNILTTGGLDGRIVDNDVTAASHIVQTYRGHKQHVCYLKWSHSGEQMASRGYDNLLHIWEPNRSRPVHTFREHTDTVKALAWCPFQSNLLASGGSGSQESIGFWNTQTGACLNSVNTGSQVRALVWSMNERELLSAHGFPKNKLTLWKYPSMNKLAELADHKFEFHFMAQSPDGSRVASAGNQALELWNIFPEVQKPASNRANGGLFPNFSSIR